MTIEFSAEFENSYELKSKYNLKKKVDSYIDKLEGPFKQQMQHCHA